MLAKRLPSPRPLQFLLPLWVAPASNSTATFATSPRACDGEDGPSKPEQSTADKPGQRRGPIRFEERKDWDQPQPRRKYAMYSRMGLVKTRDLPLTDTSQNQPRPGRVPFGAELKERAPARPSPGVTLLVKPTRRSQPPREPAPSQHIKGWSRDQPRRKSAGVAEARTPALHSEHHHATRSILQSTWGAIEQPQAKPRTQPMRTPRARNEAQGSARVLVRDLSQNKARHPARNATGNTAPSPCLPRHVARRPAPSPTRERRRGGPGGRSFLPLDDDLVKWLKLVDEQAITDEGANSKAGKKVEDDLEGRTVLMLNAAPKTLLESDFYRLARSGQHVEGWAGGIFKVVQARSPTTREPQGQYFLFFESRAEALLYLEDVMKLHSLSRRTLPDQWRQHPNFHLPIGPPRTPGLGFTLGLKEDPEAAARAYTLLPPTATLHMYEYPAAAIRREIRSHLSRLREDLQRQDKKSGDEIEYSPASSWYGIGKKEEKEAKEAEAIDPLPDYLARVKDAQYGEDQRKVLLHLAGSSMTEQAVRDVIAESGRERGLAWQLDEGPSGISPVEWTSEVAKIREDDYKKWTGETAATGKDDANLWKTPPMPNNVYSRFVLSFTHAAEAKRFVRIWHKTQIPDTRTERIVQVNATALW